jgi:hypothetical protein
MHLLGSQTGYDLQGLLAKPGWMFLGEVQVVECSFDTQLVARQFLVRLQVLEKLQYH